MQPHRSGEVRVKTKGQGGLQGDPALPHFDDASLTKGGLAVGHVFTPTYQHAARESRSRVDLKDSVARLDQPARAQRETLGENHGAVVRG